MTRGELDDAKRRALMLLDRWLECTGAVPTGTGWYYELQGIVEDAVECGAQGATKDFRRLDGEEDENYVIPGWRSGDTALSMRVTDPTPAVTDPPPTPEAR